MVAEKTSDWPALGVATLLLHYPELEQRVRRFVPQLSWRRQTRVAAALAGALLAAGTSGILVAAAQSREGHPLYQARLAAIYVGTVLPATGSQPATHARDLVATAAPEHGTHHNPSRPPRSRKHLTPGTLTRSVADLDLDGRQPHGRVHHHVRTKILFQRQAPSPARSLPYRR
jgi:hypothetical protein